MLTDARFATTIPNHNETTGDIVIIDLNGLTFKHLAKINFQTLRIFMNYIQNGIPIRNRGTHLINCPNFIDLMMATVRPFISNDLLKLVICIK